MSDGLKLLNKIADMMMQNHIKMKTPQHEGSIDHPEGEGAIESELQEELDSSPAKQFLDVRKKAKAELKLEPPKKKKK
jgi:hypothetical protein